MRWKKKNFIAASVSRPESMRASMKPSTHVVQSSLALALAPAPALMRLKGSERSGGRGGPRPLDGTLQSYQGRGRGKGKGGIGSIERGTVQEVPHPAHAVVGIVRDPHRARAVEDHAGRAKQRRG